MRVPLPLSEAFGADFEALISRFTSEKGLLPESETLRSPRFLTRSVIPHIRKLSALFNRLEAAPTENDEGEQPPRGKGRVPGKGQGLRIREEGQGGGLDPYWKESSNPAHLRLAYFVYFMPSNLYRVAAIWSELHRLGFKWAAKGNLRALELGAGPASGACGIAAGEKHAPVGLPAAGNWALVEQDKAMLELGSEWAQTYFADQGKEEWGTRTFHRKIDFKRGLLPAGAPTFNLWVMSYFLNEAELTAAELAELLIQAWEKHLDDEGVAILVEPALKMQSRKLLELRRELLLAKDRLGASWLQILTPCLGHQACGALSRVGSKGREQDGDWCHEEVTWWRPPYFRSIDKMAGLDRKSLPFSYLVVTRSRRAREQILPALAASPASARERLVSPAHYEGKEQEFFICGQEGKRRARHYSPDAELQRGDILDGAEVRGDVNSARVDRVKKVL